jgi:hypothetical protein
MDPILIGSIWYVNKETQEIESYLTRSFNFLKSFQINTEDYFSGDVVIPQKSINKILIDGPRCK